MEFGLLGPLQVLDSTGRSVALQGRRSRALLTLLLVHHNHAVPMERLIAGLWGDERPRSARESVQYFAYQLRKAFKQAAERPRSELLETHGSAYLLRIKPEQLDTVRFQRLIEQARTARERGELEAASTEYANALALWRGEPLEEFAQAPFARSEVLRLEALWGTATEEQLRVGLALGRHAELVGELEGLVAEQPTREGFRALLMLALYRCGRQAQALEVYQAARETLLDRLGLEPGRELQQLQRAILNQDPALELRSPEPATPRARTDARQSRAGQAETGEPSESQHEERKFVTALMVGVGRGTGSDPEDVRGHVADLASRVTALVARYGGMVQAVSMGRLLAVFGAERSHEDDPERAVRAALDICAELSAEQVQVAVAGSEAVVAATELDRRMSQSGQLGQVAATGSVFDEAVRLGTYAAPGSVVVDLATYRATYRSIEYRPIAEHPADPQHAAGVWQALTPRARTGVRLGDYGSPLVERTRELAMLSDVVDRLLSTRRPQAVTLASAPGLGKSRLVAELGRLVDQVPELVTWRVGRCPPYGRGGLWALAEVVKSHAGILETDPGKVAEEKLDHAIAELLKSESDQQRRQLRDQLESLLGPAQTPTGDRTGELFAAWSRFFTAVATQRPTVVVFEDLQWADDALLDFVEHLPERVGDIPLMVVATARLELLERRPKWGGGKRDTATLSLTPLSHGGTRMLLDALLSGTPLSRSISTELLQRAAGNPLYVEEYVRMLRERDVPDAAHSETLPIPGTVQQLIAARIDTLPEEDKRLLQDAAVIGQTGWVGALAAVAARDRDTVLTGLRRLERREFIRRARATSVEGEVEYTFEHALIRDVAYSQVLRAERVEKHQRVAGWIRELNPDGGDDQRVELLAHHYGQALTLARAAGQSPGTLAEQARNALRAAGDRALWLGAYASAERSYVAALDVPPAQVPDRAELLFGLALARVYGKHAGDTELLEVVEAFAHDGRADRAAEVLVILSLNALTRGDMHQADAYLHQALAQQAPPSRAMAWALAGGALNLMIRDEHEAAIAAGEQAASMAQQVDHPDAEGAALVAIGGARLKLGQLDGDTQMQRGIALEAQQHNPRVHYARWDRAWCLWWFGDLARCEEAVTTGHQAAIQADAATERWFGLLRAELDYHQGRWDAALTFLDAALADGPRQEEGHLIPWYWILRGRILLGRSDPDQAIAAAQTAAELADDGGDSRYQQTALALQGLATAASGDEHAARALMERLLNQQQDQPARSFAAPDEGLLVATLGTSVDLPVQLPATRWAQAVGAMTRGDFLGAADRYTQIGASVDAALARVEAARQLRARQPVQARSQLDLARPVMLAAKAGFWLDQVEQQLL